MEQAPPTSKNNGISADENNALAEKKREQKETLADQKWVVDIDQKIKHEIDQKIKQTRANNDFLPWYNLSIYRIPKCLRESDKKAYTPQTVSLGPYYHGDKRLLGMEQHKWRALLQVLERIGHKIERYLEVAQMMERDARDCYEGPIDLSSEDFVKMLVLDSCFILELFRGVDQGFESLGYYPSDPIFTMSFATRVTVPSIQRDMIMLENQIPLFVLNRIHSIQCPNSVTSVASMALMFVKPLLPSTYVFRDYLEKEIQDPKEEKIRDHLEKEIRDCKHFLQVLPRILLAVREGERWAGPMEDNRGRPMIHCVTELKEAGVKFKVKETDRFWDIDFKRGVLNIPRLPIDHGTKSLFLNLIAFEQYHLDGVKGITSYVTFMDRLIESPADVAHLRHCRIVDSCLGSDVEVADLFNCLCHEVKFDIYDSWLFKLSKKINNYYEKRHHKWRASLKQKYFNNPWSIISFFAAIVLVLLTLGQTFYALYAYYIPPS